MTRYADPVYLMMQAARTYPDLMQLVNGRIAGGEVPSAWLDNMTEPGIVMAPAGGGNLGQDYRPVKVSRIDAHCYAPTAREANMLAVVAGSLLTSYHGVSDGFRVHWVHHTAGPFPLIDPTTNWPVSIVTFQLQHTASQ